MRKCLVHFLGQARLEPSHAHCFGLSLHISLEQELSKSNRVGSLSIRNLMPMKIHVRNMLFRMSLWLPTRTSSQYENILFSIKYRYANNNLHAILAWCWGSELGVWFNLLGLTVFQCLDSLLFWILRSYCCILFKVKMFILVWVSWSHSCYFY